MWALCAFVLHPFRFRNRKEATGGLHDFKGRLKWNDALPSFVPCCNSFNACGDLTLLLRQPHAYRILFWSPGIVNLNSQLKIRIEEKKIKFAPCKLKTELKSFVMCLILCAGVCWCVQATMAKVKQVGLLAAGCQPWNKDVCAASGDRFAYCATLAIYIYQVSRSISFYLLGIISHLSISYHDCSSTSSITSLNWGPLCRNTREPSQPSAGVLETLTCLRRHQLIACSSSGMWQNKGRWPGWTTRKVSRGSATGLTESLKSWHLSPSSAVPGVPTSVSWWNSADGVAFVSQRGPLYIWVYGDPDPGVTIHKEAHSFLSDICLFRWHPNKKGKLVFGHTDGSLSIFQPGEDVFSLPERLKRFHSL